MEDVIETKNSLELFDKVIESLKDSFDKYLLWDWHRILKKGSVDDEIDNIGKWKKYENKLSKTDLKLCEPHLVENKEYKNALYEAQTTGNIENLVEVFKKCQIRLNEKLKDYEQLIIQVSNEVNIKVIKNFNHIIQKYDWSFFMDYEIKCYLFIYFINI